MAIWSILSQNDEQGHNRPIYFDIRPLVQAIKNYYVTKREAPCMIFLVHKFRHYTLRNKLVFHVNHDALKYMVNKPVLSGRIVHWVLLLQEFDFTI